MTERILSFDEYLKRNEAFRDKFVTNDDSQYTAGVWKLTATGCMDRHKNAREDCVLTSNENKTASMEYPNRAEHEERRTQNMVASLLHRGFRPLEFETLEEFCERCREY